MNDNSPPDPDITGNDRLPSNHTLVDQAMKSPVPVSGFKVQTNAVDEQSSHVMSLRTRTRHMSYAEPTLSDTDSSDSDEQSTDGKDSMQPSNPRSVTDSRCTAIDSHCTAEDKRSTNSPKSVVKGCCEPVNRDRGSATTDPIVISDMPCLPVRSVVYASQVNSVTESNRKDNVVSVTECVPDHLEDNLCSKKTLTLDRSPSQDSAPPTSQRHPLPGPSTSQSHPLPATPLTWNPSLPAPPNSQRQPLHIPPPAQNLAHPAPKLSLVTELFGDSDSDDCLSVSDDSSVGSEECGDDLADLLTSSSAQESSHEKTTEQNSITDTDHHKIVVLSSPLRQEPMAENEPIFVEDDLSPLTNQDDTNSVRVNPTLPPQQVPPVSLQSNSVPRPAELVSHTSQLGLETGRPAHLVTQPNQTGLEMGRPTLPVSEINSERTYSEEINETSNEISKETACQQEDVVKIGIQVKQAIKQVLSHTDKVDYHTPFLPCVRVETAAADTVSSEDSDSEMDTSFSLNDYMQVPILSPLPLTPMHMDTHNRSLDTPLSPLPLSPSDQNPLSPLPQSPNNVHHDPTAISPLLLSPNDAHLLSGVVSPLPQSPSERSKVITPLPVSPHQITRSHSSVHRSQFSSSSLPLHFADTAPSGVQVPKACTVVVKVTDQSTSRCSEDGDGSERVPSSRKLRLSDSSPFSPPALSDKALFSPPAFGLEAALANRDGEHVSHSRVNIDQSSHVTPSISKQPGSIEGLQGQHMDIWVSSDLPQEKGKQVNKETTRHVRIPVNCSSQYGNDGNSPRPTKDKLEIVTCSSNELMETDPINQPQQTLCKDVSTSVSNRFIGPILPPGIVLPSSNHLEDVCLEKNGAEPSNEVGEKKVTQISISNGTKREPVVKAKKKAGKKKKVSPYFGQPLRKNSREDTSFDDLLLSFGATGSMTAKSSNVISTPSPMIVEGELSKTTPSVSRGQRRSIASSLTILQEMTASSTISGNSNSEENKYCPEVGKRFSRHGSGLPPKKKARVNSSSQPVATPVHSLPGYEQQTVEIGGLFPPLSVGYQLRSRQVDFFETVKRRRKSSGCSDSNSETSEKAEHGSQCVCPGENRSHDVCPVESRSQNVCPAEIGSQSLRPAENRSQSVCPAVEDVIKVDSGPPSTCTNTVMEETLLIAECRTSSPGSSISKPIPLNKRSDHTSCTGTTIEDKFHARPVNKHLSKSSQDLTTIVKDSPPAPENVAELSDGELVDDGSCSSDGELNISTQTNSLQSVRSHVSSAAKEIASSSNLRGISSVKRRGSTSQESVVMTTRKRRHTDGATGQEEEQTPSNSPRQPLTFPSHLLQQQPPSVPDLSRVNCGYGPPKPTIPETPPQQRDKALVSTQDMLKDDIFSTPLPLVGGTTLSHPPPPVSSTLASSSGPSHSLTQQRLPAWMRCPLSLPPWLVMAMANVQSAKSHASIFGLGKNGKKKRDKKAVGEFVCMCTY